MQIDPALQPPSNSYKLMTNLVLPRPIAWVSTRSESGVFNLAPFSLFNAVGSEPPYVMVSVGLNNKGEVKDTARNITSSGEFVVNMVTEDLFDAMNISATEFPPDQSEFDAAQVETAPSVRIQTPRVARSPVSFECKLFSAQKLGKNTLFIGEVVMFHVADELIDERLRIRNYAPIGRLGSPSVYCRTNDRFDIARIPYAQWLERKP